HLFFFSSSSALLSHLPSSPTRPSSDLFLGFLRGHGCLLSNPPCLIEVWRGQFLDLEAPFFDGLRLSDTSEGRVTATLSPKTRFRSEEHTSELQSLTNLVCRLLLEKQND